MKLFKEFPEVIVVNLGLEAQRQKLFSANINFGAINNFVQNAICYFMSPLSKEIANKVP